MPDGRPWPRISIVTPSYNQGRFIEETIRSVLLQGHPDLEYIVMDGGSRDGSVAIIRKYEPWLRFWASEPDRGQTHAINKGWRMATGDHVAYLNSDDLYLPGALRALSGHLCQHPEAALVFGDCETMDERGARTGRLHPVRKPFSARRYLFEFINCIPQPSTLIHRRVLETVGYLREEFNVAMDHDYWVRIARRERMDYLPGIAACFREHPQSKSVSKMREYYSVEKAMVYDLFLEEPGISAMIPAPGRRRLARIFLSGAAGALANRRDPVQGIHYLDHAVALNPWLRYSPAALALRLVAACNSGGAYRTLRSGLDLRRALKNVLPFP